MLKMIKEHSKLFKEIDNLSLIKETNKKIDFLSLLFSIVLVGIPYFIIFFNCLMVFNSHSIMFHLTVWSLPIFTTMFISSMYLFVYQMLKCYLTDNELLNKTTSFRVFMGGLLNPFFISFGIVLAVLMEIFI